MTSARQLLCILLIAGFGGSACEKKLEAETADQSSASTETEDNTPTQGAQDNAPPAESSLADAVGTWKVDNSHSSALFRVRHLGVSNFHGRFNKVSGTLMLATDPAKSSVEFQIDPNSIFTASKDRDTHLKGPDFLNVKQFPTATFKSTLIKAITKSQYEVTGDLTLHGVTKSVTAKFEHIGSAISLLDKKTKLTGFEGTFTIRRSDFEMKYGLPKILGDEMQITVSIEAKLQK